MSEQFKQFPDEIEYEVWYSPGDGIMVKRVFLGYNNPENLYNHIKTKYPGINPEDYGIENPRLQKYKDIYNMSIHELRNELMDLREQFVEASRLGFI